MNDELPFSPYLFLIVFPAFWILILFILSQISGWANAAKLFSFNGKVDGEYYRFQTARISGIAFQSSLEVGISDIGLLLVPFLPFRLFHKRLLIPWNYIRYEKHKRFLFSGYKLRITEDHRFTIVISEKLFTKMSNQFSQKQNEITSPISG